MGEKREILKIGNGVNGVNDVNEGLFVEELEEVIVDAKLEAVGAPVVFRGQWERVASSLGSQSTFPMIVRRDSFKRPRRVRAVESTAG